MRERVFVIVESIILQKGLRMGQWFLSKPWLL